MITIVIVDDQPAVRKGLRMRLGLEVDLRVIGEAQDGQEALHVVHRLRPDIVLMDMEMPGRSGPDVTKELAALVPDSQVIILTIHDDERSREWARAAGAAAFVSKQAEDKILLQTIRKLANRSKGNHVTS